MHKIKYLIKLLIAYFLYYSGLLALYRTLNFNDKAIVLMYHRVLPEHQHQLSHSHDGIIVHDKTFAKHVSFLRRKFEIFDVHQFTDFLSNKLSVSRPACFITFDDGWHDNYTHAFPISRKVL